MVLEDILYDWSGLPREARKKMMTQTKKDSGFALSVKHANLSIGYWHNAEYDFILYSPAEEKKQTRILCEFLTASDEETGEIMHIAYDEPNRRLMVYHTHRGLDTSYVRDDGALMCSRHKDRALVSAIIDNYEKLFKTMKVAMMVNDHLPEDEPEKDISMLN
ncbi:TPA: hypothetical protein HA265_06865 [Candidatus Woesearchaeota archaeon]|nr:hypothetical protein [Candidatus Woesearchaeota archaeon]